MEFRYNYKSSIFPNAKLFVFGNEIILYELHFTVKEINIPKHCHSHYESVLFFEGNGEYTIYDQDDHATIKEKKQFFPGSYVMTGPGLVHSYTFETPYKLAYWKWEILKPEKDLKLSNFILNNEKGLNILSILQCFVNEANSPKPNADESISALSLLLMKECMQFEYPTKPNENLFSPYSSSQIARDAVRFIQDNFHLNINLTQLAERFHKSPRQMIRILKTHQPPVLFNRELTQHRLSAARQLLLTNGDMPLTKVAARCGFNNEQYFNLVFKKHEGITPGNFRKKNFQNFIVP